MSVTRTYNCDLCNEREQPDGKRELWGIYWTSLSKDAEIVIKGVREVEHHLCRGCIESIQRFDIPRARCD